MNIPVAKTFLSEDEAKAAYNVVMSGWVTQGSKVSAFEEKFAHYVGSKYAVAVSNCTTALHLAMIVAGIGPGDEVICPSMSFIATANSITYVGATPVFAEVRPSTYNIDPIHVEKLITKKTKAILAVHQVGRSCDLDALQALAKKYQLFLIEDAACAAGSSYKGKMIGGHSDLVCFSFHPRKILTTGEGGMITTSNKEYYQKLLLLRQHGMSINDRERHASAKVVFEKYLMKGFNYRMTDIQAAIGLIQLEKLDMMILERRKIAQKYAAELSHLTCLELPLEDEKSFFNFQSYMVYLKKNSPLEPEELMQKLLDAGISSRRGVMVSHKEEAYAEYNQLELPISEDLSRRSLILPLYIPMTSEEINYVTSKLIEFLN